MAQERNDIVDVQNQPASDTVSGALSGLLDQINDWREASQVKAPPQNADDSVKDKPQDRFSRNGQDDAPLPDRLLRLPELQKPRELDFAELGMKEKPPLTATERAVVRNLAAAAQDGDVEGMQMELSRLLPVGDAQSFDRVMRETADRLKKTAHWVDASWERGVNSDGKEFVRLHLDAVKYNKGGHLMNVTIGSDGTSHGEYRRGASEPTQHLSGEDALRQVMFKPGSRDDERRYLK